jgi:hypothetical protein
VQFVLLSLDGSIPLVRNVEREGRRGDRMDCSSVKVFAASEVNVDILSENGTGNPIIFLGFKSRSVYWAEPKLVLVLFSTSTSMSMGGNLTLWGSPLAV